MISIDLARRLCDAGLEWRPANGDRFIIPDRDLDDHVFSISDMTIDVREVRADRVIAFNGTVEWALDAILQREVVWLPSEAQLRERLGERFDSLHRTPGGFRCEVMLEGERLAFEAEDPADSYGEALLRQLARPALAQPPR